MSLVRKVLDPGREIAGTPPRFPVRVASSGYHTLREKNPSSASTSTTIRMIQRMLTVFESPFPHVQRGCARGGYARIGAPTSRSTAGSTPHRSASSVNSRRPRCSRAGDGARTARIMRFFGVCSVETNSITSAR